MKTEVYHRPAIGGAKIYLASQGKQVGIGE